MIQFKVTDVMMGGSGTEYVFADRGEARLFAESLRNAGINPTVWLDDRTERFTVFIENRDKV